MLSEQFLSTGAKEATLQFTATQPVPDDSKLVITIRSDGEASHNLMVKVNGAPRVIVVAKGNGCEQSITVPFSNDDVESGATIALEQKRAGGNILFLHSIHVLGVSEVDRLAQIERDRLDQVERDRLAQAEIDRIESAA